MAIEFFNVKSGERKKVVTEPMISAYYNSSNQHVNATRGQDFGWRLAPATIKRIQDIKRDFNLMNQVASTFRIPLDSISDTDVLRWISREDAKQEAATTQEADYTQQYEEELRALENSGEAVDKPKKIVK